MIAVPCASRTLLGLALPWLVSCASTTSQTRPPERAEHEPAAHGTHGDERASTETPPDAPPTPATRDAGPSSAPHHLPSGAISEQDAFQRASPVFQRYCASCHTTTGDRSRAASLRHFNMDAYPLGGHHANQIAATIREVLGASGERATMPRDRPGVVQGDELRLVLEWADAFDRAHPAGQGHGGHSH